MYDVLVLGGGVAGLSAAVRAANAGHSVAVVTKADLGASATQYAQGGVAAVLEDEADSPELHLSDTLAAGAGLCDLAATKVLVEEGPQRIRELIEMGAAFDRASEDAYALGREGGHSVARILHAGGDATGAEIERALVAAVRATAADVHERWFAEELLIEGGRAAGIRAFDDAGSAHDLRATHTIIATGGAGQCFAVTTNPTLSTGDGTAMALRAGAAVADIEFMQFHPTALHHPSMPRPLLSEALRGEGAVLRDEHGIAFMDDEHPLSDLAPRDVVARAIARRLVDRNLEHLWLDATPIPDFEHRFPTVSRAVTSIGLDPECDWLPVAPAAHYLSGGVCTDLDGATTIPNLWACGEAACSGVHGANRLASNSLLDGLVFAARAVEALLGGKSEAEPTGALRNILDGEATSVSTPARGSDGFAERSRRSPSPPRATHDAGSGRAQRGRGEPREDDDADGAETAGVRARLQSVMTRYAGVLRDEASLLAAVSALEAIEPGEPEDQNLKDVSLALVRAALAREESRGTHTRLDFPETSPAFLGRFVFAGADEPHYVPLPEPAAVR